MSKRVCLFAHFDPRGRIGAHVVHYLRQLCDCGFTTYVALSGMEGVSAEDAAYLQQVRAVPHPRPNEGLDFGAWQELVASGYADGAETILLANDSVFGPLTPLGPIIERMISRGDDVWGMVESREQSWHLQSWFVCFTASAFATPSVTRVLQLPFRNMNKAEIVLHGELGLGVAIATEGLRWNACWRSPTHTLRRLVPGNSMHIDYLSIIRSGKVPFLKVELLRDNPAQIPWIDHWRRQVAKSSIFSADLIDRHFSNLGAHVTPYVKQSFRLRVLYAAMSCDRREALASLLKHEYRRKQPSTSSG